MTEQAKSIFHRLTQLPLFRSKLFMLGAGLTVVVLVAVVVTTSPAVNDQGVSSRSNKNSVVASPSPSAKTSSSPEPTASAASSSPSPSASNSPSASTPSESVSGPTESQVLAMERALGYFDNANWQWFRPDLSRTIVASLLQDDGFSSQDATYAANNISADWVAEATSMAFQGEYFSLDEQNTPWYSKAWLISRLQIEGFSLTEATQGVEIMAEYMIDWGDHALNRVSEYDSLPARQDYINLLRSEGFTQAEAEYATEGWD